MEDKEINIEKLYKKGVEDSFIVGLLTIILTYLIKAQVFEPNYSFAGNPYIELIIGIGVLIVWLYKSIDLLANYYFSAGGIYESEISIEDGGSDV